MDEKLAALAQDNNTDHTQSVNLVSNEKNQINKKFLLRTELDFQLLFRIMTNLMNFQKDIRMKCGKSEHLYKPTTPMTINLVIW